MNSDSRMIPPYHWKGELTKICQVENKKTSATQDGVLVTTSPGDVTLRF